MIIMIIKLNKWILIKLKIIIQKKETKLKNNKKMRNKKNRNNQIQRKLYLILIH